MEKTKKYNDCVEEMCNKRKYYGYHNQKALYCRKHKKDEMIHLGYKNKCLDCGKFAIFNFKNITPGIYCKKHCKDGMVDVYSKKCLDCEKIPLYNFEGIKSGIYCKQHKKDGMINVKGKKKYCEEKNCKRTSPNFNFNGEKNGLFCKKHMKDGMVDVRHKRCEEVNCDIQPNFNYKGEKKPLFCEEHKKDGMVNVKNKVCQKENCELRPNFNYEGEKRAIFCSFHQEDNMVDILNTKCQGKDGEVCKKRPCYNYRDTKIGIFCKRHKKEGMIDVSSRICKMIGCETRANNRNYEGYCLRCFMYTFPDKSVSRNYKTKEKTVSDFVKSNNSDLNMSFDKTVDNGCSKRRPDILIDLHSHIIIIEIDENQHESYDNTCDNKRIMEISQDLGHPHIVFIRFNPDSYNKENNKIKSCWKINKFGICVVSNEKEWNSRLTELQSKINYWRENIPTKHITQEHLFYDSL